MRVIVASIGMIVEVTVLAGNVTVVVEWTTEPVTPTVVINVTTAFEVVVQDDGAVLVDVIVHPAISLVRVLVRAWTNSEHASEMTSHRK